MEPAEDESVGDGSTPLESCPLAAWGKYRVLFGTLCLGFVVRDVNYPTVILHTLVKTPPQVPTPGMGTPNP